MQQVLITFILFEKLILLGAFLSLQTINLVDSLNINYIFQPHTEKYIYSSINVITAFTLKSAFYFKTIIIFKARR